jgi:MoxR-like ATPase
MARNGITILMHGKPGTGKTETVMQLAKATGRNIYRVDISQIEKHVIWRIAEEDKKTLSGLLSSMRTNKPQRQFCYLMKQME